MRVWRVRDSYEKCSESIQFFSSAGESSEGEGRLCLLSNLPSMFVKDTVTHFQVGKLKHILHTTLYVCMVQCTEVPMTAKYCVLTKSVHCNEFAIFTNIVCLVKGTFSLSH